MSYWVYVHTCKANGKRYIGCTTQAKPERRWGRNGEGYLYNDHFRSAILKHGWSNFQHEVFEVDSKEEMYRKEVELISFYHSNDPRYGYNNSTGGEKSSLGCKHSEEAKKKMSRAHKGKVLGEEHKKRISETSRERWTDPEYRKHMSKVRKGNPHKPHSEETKRRIAEARKGTHPSEEARKHMSEAHKGKSKPHSEETKRRIAEAAKNRPKIKIKLPDGTIVEITKQLLARDYINKGKKFEYVS